MRWLKLGLILSLIATAVGLFSAEFRPLLCFSGAALIFAFLIWVLRRQQQLFKEEFSPDKIYLTRNGYMTGAQAFAETAQKFADHRVAQAVYTPFTTKWPTYGLMDIDQLDWYFYWRDQVRQGNFPKTDTAYIYLLVYELIHDVGVLNLQLGYEQLLALWQNYRTDHPALDDNLPDWIVDYATINNLAPRAETVYAHLSDGTGETVDWIVQARIDAGWANLPLPILDRLTDHKIAQSSFVKAGNGALVEIGIRLALAAVDDHLRSHEQVGIWEKYRPKTPIRSTRKPFQSAIYGRETPTLTIGDLYIASKHQPLRDFLTSVVKYTENKLREQVNFRGRLQVKGLDMSLQQLIDKVTKSNFDAPESVKAELLAALQKIAEKPISAELKLSPTRKPAATAQSIPSPAAHATFETENRTLAELYNDHVFRRYPFPIVAKQMADWVEQKTALVPFQKYEAIYSDMRLSQLQYYFYWRNEVRAERYPKTETAYIFVHIIELLNNVGVSNPTDGYRQLMGLWTHYDDAHPIGRHLVTWITDYLTLNPCDIDPLIIYRNPLAIPHLYTDLDLNIALTAALDLPDAPIPLAILDRLIDHPLIYGQFAQAGYGDWLEQELSHALNYLEAELMRAGEKTLFERFRAKKTVLVQRFPYHGIMQTASNDLITIANIFPYTQQDGLREQLTQIVKYVEQGLHEKADYRPNVRGAKRMGGVRPILDRYLAQVQFSGTDVVVTTQTKNQTGQAQWQQLEVLRKSAERTYGRSTPVPLEFSYALNVDQLAADQHGWYVYWRKRARAGNYLPTPAAYVILFAQELVNNVGVDDGYSQLLTLWQQYRNQSIGDRLASWLLAYTFVNAGAFTPRQHLLRPEIRPYAIQVAPDLVLTATKPNIAEMPLDLLAQFSDHNIQQSSFYTSSNSALLQRYLPLAVAQVDEYVTQRTGQGLLMRFTPPKGVAVSIESCATAFYPNWPTQIALPNVPAYSQQRSFCNLITGIVKYTENHLRQLQDVRGRLRGIQLSDDVQKVLDDWFPTIAREQRGQLAKPAIEIDSSRIEQLRAESEAVFEMLNLEPAESAEPIIEQQPATLEPPVHDEWQALWQALDSPHHQLLQAMINHADPLSEIRAIANRNGTMPALLIDTINEHTQAIIGDLLLELDPAPRFIDDEYRDNIALLF